MAITAYKPTTSGRRHASVDAFLEVTKSRPEKSLTFRQKRHAGRNAQGKITVHHQGGGHKKKVRIVDTKRLEFDRPAKVIAIEYDPNRTAYLALVENAQGVKSYVIAVEGLKVGDTILSSQKKIDIKAGNRLPLEFIPAGIVISCLEYAPTRGGQLVQAAGMAATIMAAEGDFAQVKLPSGEVRNFHKACLATIGQISNSTYRTIRLGKAGRMRWRGVRPTVRGKAKNPVDHPHGGGEGKHPIGLTHPKTPWGKHALGVRTRRMGKQSSNLIISRRHKRK